MVEGEKCTICGYGELQEGWLTDVGGTPGFVRWTAGRPRTGVAAILNNLLARSGQREEVVARRCGRCSHLELFVRPAGDRRAGGGRFDR